MRAYALSHSFVLSIVICLLSLVPFAIHFVGISPPCLSCPSPDAVRRDSFCGALPECLYLSPNAPIVHPPPSRCGYFHHVSTPVTDPGLQACVASRFICQYLLTLATVLTISRAAAILGDFLLVVITARSLWRRPLRERLAEMKRVSFARVLLWNGQYPHLKHRSCIHGTTKFLSDRDDILRVSYVQQTVVRCTR